MEQNPVEQKTEVVISTQTRVSVGKQKANDKYTVIATKSKLQIGHCSTKKYTNVENVPTCTNLFTQFSSLKENLRPFIEFPM